MCLLISHYYDWIIYSYDYYYYYYYYYYDFLCSAIWSSQSVIFRWTL